MSYHAQYLAKILIYILILMEYLFHSNGFKNMFLAGSNKLNPPHNTE